MYFWQRWRCINGTECMWIWVWRKPEEGARKGETSITGAIALLSPNFCPRAVFSPHLISLPRVHRWRGMGSSCQKTSCCNSPALGCFPGCFTSKAAFIFETKVFQYFHRKPWNKQFLISKMYPLPADTLYSETAFSIKWTTHLKHFFLFFYSGIFSLVELNFTGSSNILLKDLCKNL